MEEKIYYMDIDKETNLINGFYIPEIHGEDIPEGAIAITEELWQELLSYGQAEVNTEILTSLPAILDEQMVLNMTHKEAFSKHVIVQEPVEQAPSEIDKLKEEVAELKAILYSTLGKNKDTDK